MSRHPASARSVAYLCLQRIEHEGAYANLVTPAELQRSGLSDRDRHFVTELVYGTTRMRRACDALVDRFISSEPQPEIRTLLRLGAYQLEFAKVAPHAAVGETVELAPKRARPFVCLLYTSDAADERSSVDLGGRRIIKKKHNQARRG